MRQATRLLEQIDGLVRGPAINKVLKSVGDQIIRDTKAVLPKPGYPGDKVGLKPLRDTLKAKVLNYRGGEIKVLVVGYEVPSGAHGSPLELGHEKWLWGEHIEGSPVEPHPYLKEVVKLTKVTQNRAMIEGARAALNRLKGS